LVVQDKGGKTEWHMVAGRTTIKLSKLTE